MNGARGGRGARRSGPARGGARGGRGWPRAGGGARDGSGWQHPRHVVVTGAAGAIGGALARALRGAWPEVELALVDRDADGLATLARELAAESAPGAATRNHTGALSVRAPDGRARGSVELGSRDGTRGDDAGGTARRGLGRPGGPGATMHVADLRDLESLPGLVARIAQAGPIDGLVNCAGVMRVQQLASWRWQDAWELLALDLLAPLRLQDLVVRAMVAAGAGTIVNVASMAGRVPLRGCAYYGAAKAGLAMASEIARADLASRGVRVVTVYPGPVRSALEQGARDAYGGGGLFGRLAPTGEPGELASRIVEAIEADLPRVIYPRLYGLGWVAPNVSRRVALEYGPPPVA